MLKEADVHFASRVANWSLRVVMLVTLAAVAAFIGERFLFEKTISKSWVKIGEISDARATILLSEEQLTMSAFAYAQTSDWQWKNRYKKSMDEFEAAVKKVRAVTDDTIRQEFDASFTDAHGNMQSLEQLVIDLIDNNEKADAANVFGSPRYLKNKELLTASINTLLTKADAQARSELAATQKRAIILIGSFIVFTAAGLWWLSRRLKAAMSKAEASFEVAHLGYLDQLSINHEATLKKSRMEQVGALAATMAHELRNPLGAVRTSTFMLQRLWSAPDERITRAFERINTGIERCDALISQLLDFTRIGAATKKPTHFDNWLESELHDLAKTLHASVKLTCVLGAPDTKLDMDPDQVKSAISKILTNASEAMVNRHGELETVDEATPHIEVSTCADEHELSIVFKDNGHGIAPEHLPNLKDPFFTTKNFGAGLGLPSVQQVVEQHAGNLEISNNTGGGALVKMTLKAA
jgi:signal transduction histidine kinase